MKIIILAGGSGNRLWPLIHPPKQFSKLFGEESLFQKTVNRFLKQYAPEDMVVVTNKDQYELAIAQAPILKNRVIIEPESKNTAFALLYALEWLDSRDELEDEFLVTPSDHIIEPEEEFLKAIEWGRERARGHLLFGITPTHPHTGYGYILANLSQVLPKVNHFVEKPEQEVAEKLLEHKGCLWNSGIFLFQTEPFFKDLDSQAVPPLSIDKAFLEHFDNLFVLPLSLSWSDLGTWESIYEVFPKDASGNVMLGQVKLTNVKNSLIISQNHPLQIEDIEDMCIVGTEEGLLARQRQKQVLMQLSRSFPSP